MKKERIQEQEEPRRPWIFFSAGEPSGDLHAAELIEELRRRFPQMKVSGFGGPKMAKAGCELITDLTELAIMWFGRALWNLPTFIGYLNRAEKIFREEKPDLIVLVDYPGFNWQIAKRAKRAGIPVCYFMPPQLWGWAAWRIKKMKKWVDFVLSPLPFETKWFQERGVNAIHIGHPFFEEVRRKSYDWNFVESLTTEKKDAPILALLPGSRNQEILHNFSDMVKTVKIVQESVPNLRPVVAAFKEAQEPMIRDILKREKADFPIYIHRTPELIRACVCALAVSGSVSIELLANAKPTVIYYRIGRLPHFVMRFFRRVKYITLVNLLAADRVEGESLFYDEKQRIIPARPSQREWDLMLFPEFLTEKNRSQEAALPLIEWLTDPVQLAARRRQLADLLAQEDQQGSPIKNAADFLEKHFQE